MTFVSGLIARTNYIIDFCCFLLFLDEGQQSNVEIHLKNSAAQGVPGVGGKRKRDGSDIADRDEEAVEKKQKYKNEEAVEKKQKDKNEEATGKFQKNLRNQMKQKREAAAEADKLADEVNEMNF